MCWMQEKWAAVKTWLWQGPDCFGQTTGSEHLQNSSSCGVLLVSCSVCLQTVVQGRTNHEHTDWSESHANLCPPLNAPPMDTGPSDLDHWATEEGCLVLFSVLSYGQLGTCASFTWGCTDAKTPCGKKTSWWIECCLGQCSVGKLWVWAIWHVPPI